ncbi:4-(cytidine 5'-diphospho)-2-C-methyl-D-erythritol kinase [Paracoccus aminophilus]|uniref:4-diphosphocytidyl-2-C-methyl-D-erythritol kinase n=1 Tax=Paracoccus aminophilus JCM 7686 TaxID=1367847 RepID=S5XVF9_PARAH|nr:4-(cytidine 5'-diphospho)-2-C-methyl-D-erythritol kinase [Paracoccus aminophilus]AGT07360.1 4-diphosphocytidyl-2-C-methyl-D-erythritol kinase [Paracoccus aminophilus JCM 7686]
MTPTAQSGAGEAAEFAPAKINLTLHVTGQRADGYHLLDSLVVFAGVGDRVEISPGPLSLTIDGPFAAGLSADADNLCLRAARLAGSEGAIRLTKNLPLASGIGGGSADAAAVLRAFRVWPERPEMLGADVPVCLAGRPLRMRGLGEILEPVPDLPPLAVVLVNPGKGLATPDVFRALTQRDNPAMPDLPEFFDRAGLLAFVAACRNDLEAPAISLLPEIADCLNALRDAGAELARMSGSGATCFGIFPDAEAAATAAEALARPGWWVVPTTLASPQTIG